MADENVATTGIAVHGAGRLPSVEVDSFNIELKDDDGFLGDRASKGAFRSILDSLRKEMGVRDQLRVVATGGDAEWIASGMPEIESVDEDLTLHGLRLVGNLHAPH